MLHFTSDIRKRGNVMCPRDVSMSGHCGGSHPLGVGGKCSKVEVWLGCRKRWILKHGGNARVDPATLDHLDHALATAS